MGKFLDFRTVAFVLATLLLIPVASVKADTTGTTSLDTTSVQKPTLFQIYAQDSLVTQALGMVDKAAADTAQWKDLDLDLLRTVIGLKKEIDSARAYTVINRAKELAAEGHKDSALAQLNTLIQQTDNLQILTTAKKAHEEISGYGFLYGAWTSTKDMLKSNYVLVPVLLVLLYLVFYSLLNIGMWAMRNHMARKWTVLLEESDKTPKLGEHVLSTFSSWNHGKPLISYSDFMQGSFHSALEFDLSSSRQTVSIDYASAFESIPGGWSKFIGQLFSHWQKAWKSYKSKLEASILLEEEKKFVVVMSATARRLYHSLRETCESDCSTEQKLRRIERGCFRMIYFILSRLHGKSYEGAGELHDGLEQLQQYAKTADPEDLEKALSKFEEARRTSPELLEAHLLEGIALDLSEQHGKSVRRLTYLLDVIKQQGGYETDVRLNDLYVRTLFSRAVSNHRKYKSEPAKLALEDLETLIGGDNERSNRGLVAHAYVLKASVVVHEPLYHDYPWPALNTLKDFQQWESQLRGKANGLIGKAEEIIEHSVAGGLSDEDRRELDFSIRSTKGNLELNIQKSLERFAARTTVSGGETIWRMCAARTSCLDAAYEHFRYCEENFPVRIETVMNIATTLLSQDRYDRATEYCEKAIAMNQKYEYAYYRLFETRLKKLGDSPPREELKEVLTRFKKGTGRTEPAINHFFQLLEKHLPEWKGM